MSDASDAPQVGQVVQHPIARVPHRPYLIADDTVVGTTVGPNPYVELTLLAIKGNFTHQNFVMIQTEPEPILQAANVSGGFVVEDQGAVRFTPESALAAAVGVLKHLKVGGLIQIDDIRKALTDAGL